MMKNVCPLVSVIVPVYNTEKYLPRCLDSIVEQSYSNIEIVIVDNASTGNVLEIFNEYKELYTNRNWVIVRHKKNQGLFKARISGVEKSSGDFVAFIDSDDRISFDYYRLLINKAVEKNADMVAADTWYESSKGELFKFNLSSLEMFPEQVETKDLLRLMYKCEGKCYSFHLVWNKIYSKSLWNKAYPYLKKIDHHIVMCEDYVFSTVFYALANSLYIEHNAHHYYFKGEEAYTSVSASYSKVEKNISDLEIVFAETKKFLQEIDRYDELQKNHLEFQKRYYRFWRRNIDIAKLNVIEKKKLRKKLDEVLPIDDSDITETDIYNTLLSTNVTDYLDYIKKEICKENIKYISFDIFDTLILRPLFTPEDLFQLLDIRVKQKYPNIKYDLYNIRVNAEKNLRKGLKFASGNIEEVTLDDIYEEISKQYGLEEEIVTCIKEEEITLELELCEKRKTGYELFKLAKSYNKKIIMISDMYLPADTIKKILSKCGYEGEYRLFVSSEEHVTKHTTEMYKQVLRVLAIKHANSILHIGDNSQSDVENAKRTGFNAIHLPCPVEIMKGYYPSLYNGSLFNQAFLSDEYSRKDYALKFLGMRCMLGIIANKIFDNPFCNFNQASQFDASPYIVGYTTLGMHFLGVSKWLQDNASIYDKVHFIARDGYFIKKCFDKLFPQNKSDYLHVSRKSLIPLLVYSSKDYLSLKAILKYSSLSPEKLEKLIKCILPEDVSVSIICKSNNYIYNKYFTTEEELEDFLLLLNKYAYNEQVISKEVMKIKSYLKNKIGQNDATFDVGYSGRTERLINNLLETSLDAFYIHMNNDIGLKSAKDNHFNISCYYDYTPLVAGALREMLMSEEAPSCVGYTLDKSGATVPVFEDYDSKYPESLILYHIRKGAIDFITDFSNYYKSFLSELPFRVQDASILFEFFLNKASTFDRWIFKCFDFEDDLFIGSKITLLDFWNMQTVPSDNGLISQYSGMLAYYPKWKKFLILSITDRKLLKEKIKDKYSTHPVLLKLLKISYSIPRGIYHIFKR